MYAVVTRRRLNQARRQETQERAAREFWPKLQEAPGFVSFSLIHGEDGTTTAVAFFESKAQADAFGEEGEKWQRTLDDLGHQLEGRNDGEVGQHITASS